MSKTIDDVLVALQTEKGDAGFRKGRRRAHKQALYELLKAEAETIELTHKDDTRIWRQAKKYVPLNKIAKLLGVTNADQ